VVVQRITTDLLVCAVNTPGQDFVHASGSVNCHYLLPSSVFQQFFLITAAGFIGLKLPHWELQPFWD